MCGDTNMLFDHNAESFLLTLSRLSERTQEKLFIHRRRALYKEGESGFRDPREGGQRDTGSSIHTPRFVHAAKHSGIQARETRTGPGNKQAKRSEPGRGYGYADVRRASIQPREALSHRLNSGEAGYRAAGEGLFAGAWARGGSPQ